MTPANPVADSGPLAPEVAELATLYQLEQTAVRTYDLAVERFADHPLNGDLRTIRHDHDVAAGALRDHIRNRNGEPDDGPAGGNLFEGWTSGPGRLIDPATALTVLRRGEEAILAEYERVLQAEEFPQECRFAMKAELLPHCHEHMDRLAELASAPNNEG